MRINKYIAQASGLSRRAADEAINQERVMINGAPATPGQEVQQTDAITLDNVKLHLPAENIVLALHKPVGYVCSRQGQGSQTVYDLLPPTYHHLKPVGRLDKDSSGILLLTNDGDLAHHLTHPRFHKLKQYEVTLDKPLAPLHHQMIADRGIQLDDGVSQFALSRMQADDTSWHVTMHEGRNRQIRRTFEALGYNVTRLHRTQFGPYQLDDLAPGAYQQVS